MSESATASAPTLKTYTMSVIIGGKLQAVEMVSDYDRSKQVVSVGSAEELKAAKGSEPELVDAFAAEFSHCERRFQALCEGGVKSALYANDQQIEKMMQKDAKALYASRTSVKLNSADEKLPSEPEWTPLHVLDLHNADVKKMFRQQLIDDFAKLKPAESGVRLLIIDTLVWTTSVKVQLRLFVYYMTEARYIENENAHIVKLGLRETITSARKDLAPESIHMVILQWSLLAIERAVPRDGQSAEDARAEAESKWPETQKRIVSAQMCYKKMRDLLRRRALMVQLPLIVDFLSRHLAPLLLDRFTKAAPYIPDRLLMRVQLENGGQIIDVDQTTGITQSELKKLIWQAEAELKDVKKRLIDTPDDAALQSYASDTELVRSTLQARNTELVRIDPSTQIMFDFYDRGKWQDIGESIEMGIVYDPPYDEMRTAIERAAKKTPSPAAPAQETTEVVPTVMAAAPQAPVENVQAEDKS